MTITDNDTIVTDTSCPRPRPIEGVLRIFFDPAYHTPEQCRAFVLDGYEPIIDFLAR